MIRNDFVVTQHLLTDHQLNTAVVRGPHGAWAVWNLFGLRRIFDGRYSWRASRISGVGHASVHHHSADALDRTSGGSSACAWGDSRNRASCRRIIDLGGDAADTGCVDGIPCGRHHCPPASRCSRLQKSDSALLMAGAAVAGLTALFFK